MVLIAVLVSVYLIIKISHDSLVRGMGCVWWCKCFYEYVLAVWERGSYWIRSKGLCLGAGLLYLELTLKKIVSDLVAVSFVHDVEEGVPDFSIAFQWLRWRWWCLENGFYEVYRLWGKVWIISMSLFHVLFFSSLVDDVVWDCIWRIGSSKVLELGFHVLCDAGQFAFLKYSYFWWNVIRMAKWSEDSSFRVLEVVLLCIAWDLWGMSHAGWLTLKSPSR